jgi:release factor glutamine methyltransferase
MTSVAAALAEGTALLRATSSAPRADALALLEATLSGRREWILAFGDRSVPARSEAAFRALCKRRREGTPTAYLLGRAWFCGREFVVDERVLIPRPETEHLVDEAVVFLGDRQADVLDVGTGSGALACSIAAATRATVAATDISSAALAVARENARRLNVSPRCTFHEGDLAEPVTDRRFDLVLANLPYIPSGDLPSAPDPVSFEPRLALDGGCDGLSLYRRLLAMLPALLKPKALVLLEAAPPTIARLKVAVKSALPGFAISLCQDYARFDRYVRAERRD